MERLQPKTDDPAPTLLDLRHGSIADIGPCSAENLASAKRTLEVEIHRMYNIMRDLLERFYVTSTQRSVKKDVVKSEISILRSATRSNSKWKG